MAHTFTDEQRATAMKNRDLASLPLVFCHNSHKAHSLLKRLLLQYMGFTEKCSVCDIADWNGKPLTLQLDHIDGDSYNNEVTNLRFICPNCHSQTDTFCGKANTGKKIVSDDALRKAVGANINVRKVLLAVGLTPKGGNYTRVRNIMVKENLSFKDKQ